MHDYLKVNLNLVWQIIEQNLSDLKRQVAAIMQNP
ncbi:MAG: HepT-like ribonuclease domain-containing protein [Dolichospermum sp.]